jgi:predicted nucleic acid-binding protein
VTDLIVADAGPLIGLTRIDFLWILHRLYSRILIPPAVHKELQLDAKRPGSRALARSKKSGWLRVTKPPANHECERLAEILDEVEAEAILLAQVRGARLLIDEKKGRIVARRRGVTVIGIGAVLLAAKRIKAVERVSPILKQLNEHGYRFSDPLRKESLTLAGEDQ